jgi:hypothetical protein
MDHEAIKRWCYFLGAILLSVLLVWFGAKLLFISGGTFSHTQLLVFGLLTIVGGICLLSLPSLKNNWLGGLLVTAVGFYGCARAAGTIQEPWLARVLGVVAWAGVIALLHATWPTRRKHAEKQGREHGGTERS